jgi:branched-chain amino acid transport system substrate-binding protein
MIGMFNTAQWAHDLDNARNKQFVQAFAKEYNNRYPSMYAAQAYDVIMAIDAAVKAVNGQVADKPAVLAALKKADFGSVRGNFKYGPNNYPIQAYYVRVIEKNAEGKVTNKLVGTVFDAYQDVYASQCKK